MGSFMDGCRYASATALDTLATCYGNCAALLKEYYDRYYELAQHPQAPALQPLAPSLLQDRVARPLGADTNSPHTNSHMRSSAVTGGMGLLAWKPQMLRAALAAGQALTSGW